MRVYEIFGLALIGMTDEDAGVFKVGILYGVAWCGRLGASALPACS